MDFVDGQDLNLDRDWEGFYEDTKERVARQLKGYLVELREIRNGDEGYIGSIHFGGGMSLIRVWRIILTEVETSSVCKCRLSANNYIIMAIDSEEAFKKCSNRCLSIKATKISRQELPDRHALLIQTPHRVLSWRHTPGQYQGQRWTCYRYLGLGLYWLVSRVLGICESSPYLEVVE